MTLALRPGRPPWPFPPAAAIVGREVVLEPVIDERRFGELHTAFAVPGFDDAWAYLSIGPFASLQAFTAGAGPVLLSKEARFYALVERENGRAQGFLSLMRVDRDNGVIEVGNILLGPGLQRTRAASEGFALLFAHVFDTLGYRRLEWKCNDRNLPSKRAALRLGFSPEGLFRQHMIVKGENRDTAWFAMLDHEWPAVREAFAAWLGDGNFDESGRQKRSLQSFQAP